MISSDGNTVWVNDDVRCVARLGRAGGEIFANNPINRWEAGSYLVIAKCSFEQFQEECAKIDVVVEEKHRPRWSR